jgi:galactitol-specific phosphotransferase system IIB component
MKFEDIKKVNETIITTDVKGKQYAEVNQRIKAFRMLYPTGTIETELVSIDDGMCIMRAKVYVMGEHGLRTLLGTGTAYEKENSSFINKTSYIENCETSAVGRALAMCGIGIDTSIASKEEVENAIEQQEQDKKEQEEKKKLLVDIKNLMIKKKVLANEIAEHFEKNSADMTIEELEEVVKWLGEK